MEALRRALAGQELTVALVDVGRNQPGAFRVGTRDDKSGYTADVRSKTCSVQVAFVRGRWNEDFAAEVAAFLLGCKLILEMHAGGTCFDIRLHDFMGVERSPEARFGVRDDGRKPIAAHAPIRVFDLIGTTQRAVDALAQLRSGIRGIQALIRIHYARGVVVGRHLPARKVDGFQAGSDHLHGLIARYRPE
jgi:hypothetical protein